ncbi:MAG: glycosyltransferase family 39 protein, partial [Candidatus Omnitrophica bacterium]|nr:glycosyltransferase family 39 protein [Candidatus Omnitrophota bacterium]
MKKDLFYTLLSIAAIVLLGFSVYGNCLGGEFILDDEALVRDNLSIKRWSNIPKIFSEDIAASVETGSTFYRPLQMLTYMFDYSLWRLDPKGYHLSNVLLHILVSLSLFWLINMLYNNRLLSLLASLFFLSHPIHTEAVAYISGRADPLACLFMLLSFIFYIRYLRKENMASFLLIIISYVLSLLSRENSLILPLILLLYHYIFKEKIRLKPFLSVLSLTAFYIIIRFTLLRFLLAGGVYHTRLYQRIPGFLVALASYIRLLFAPFDLHMEYTNQIFYLDNPLAVA